MCGPVPFGHGPHRYPLKRGEGADQFVPHVVQAGVLPCVSIGERDRREESILPGLRQWLRAITHTDPLPSAVHVCASAS